jgi:sugar diacid utilization regulator
MEFVEQIQQNDFSEETKSRTLQDEAEQNRDFNASTITIVPELSEEEIKKETSSQEENNIDDSYSASASATDVSEEVVLKEAEPETNEEIKSLENKQIYEEEEDQVGLGFKFCALKITSSICPSISTNPLMTLSILFY